MRRLSRRKRLVKKTKKVVVGKVLDDSNDNVDMVEATNLMSKQIFKPVNKVYLNKNMGNRNVDNQYQLASSNFQQSNGKVVNIFRHNAVMSSAVSEVLVVYRHNYSFSIYEMFVYLLAEFIDDDFFQSSWTGQLVHNVRYPGHQYQQ